MAINWLKCFFTAIFILFLLFIVIAYGSLFTLLQGTDLVKFIKSGTFLGPFFFSLLSSAAAALLAGLVAIPSAYVLARYSFPGKELAEGILFLPVLVPPLVSGLALLVLFSTSGGQWLAEQGLRFVFTPAGAVLAQFFIATPFALRTIKVALAKVEVSMEEAASTLGDSPTRVFTRITLPLARHGIASGLLLAWARAMGEFGATIMLAGSLARYTETLPVAIFLRFSTGELETAVAMAALMMILAFLIMLITRRTFSFQ
jgi:molybdate transport system permease protein